MNESILNKVTVLKLNKSWMPMGFSTPQAIMAGLFGGAYSPINLAYNDEDTENANYEKPMVIEIVKSLDDWMQLPILPSDLTINTPNMIFKVPVVVVSKNHDKLPSWEPTLSKKNIKARDGGICQYTGKHVGNAGNIDHVIPTSRGGKNTWTNMVWCDAKINAMKGDKLPEEVGLKLIRKPYKPTLFTMQYGERANDNDKRWIPFLGNFMKGK
jgi:5-methylcytosine-specific restriction endonuclease McrA